MEDARIVGSHLLRREYLGKGGDTNRHQPTNESWKTESLLSRVEKQVVTQRRSHFEPRVTIVEDFTTVSIK